MVSFADKLRQVVTANFVEISRPDTSAKNSQKAQEPVSEAAPEIPLSQTALGPLVSESATVDVASDETANPISVDSLETGAVAETDKGDDATAPEDLADAEAEPTETDTELSHASGAESLGDSGDYSQDPMALVSDDDTIEFDQVFARAALPNATGFTAEQALSMLYSMPADLPLRIKRLTVKATLDAVGQAVGATTSHIVADASQKVSTLETFIGEVTSRAQELRDATDTEIEELEKQIAEKQTEKAVITRREEAVSLSCRAKIDELDQVVAFFMSEENEADSTLKTEDSQAVSEPEELPAYLQEDAVKRLLGLPGDSEDATSTEVAPSGGRSRGFRTSR